MSTPVAAALGGRRMSTHDDPENAENNSTFSHGKKKHLKKSTARKRGAAGERQKDVDLKAKATADGLKKKKETKKKKKETQKKKKAKTEQKKKKQEAIKNQLEQETVKQQLEDSDHVEGEVIHYKPRAKK